MTEFKYRPDIDGIRTVAVTLVILYHAGFGFTGGFLGVDVFFVISGYLITGLILKQQQTNDFLLSAFWLRRIRRILPASTFLVITTLLFGGLLLLPSDLNDLAKSTVWQQIMSSNVYFWRNSDYFDSPAETKPLLHTWSLAVEEQFYLVYPLILVLGRRLTKRGLCSLLSSMAVISFLLSEWGVRSHPSATFYLLPFRAWELLLGGLLCFAPPPNRLPLWIHNLISWSSLATILATGWLYDSTTRFPGSAALVPCLATACLIYCNSVQLTFPGRLLATRPIVFTGLLSYSLYLWHWPVLAFSRYWLGNLLPLQYRLLLLGVIYGLAYASWRFIEVPFRKPSIQSTSSVKSPFIAASISTSIVIALSIVVILSKGAEFRFSAKVLALDKRANDRVNPELETDIEAASTGNIPTIGLDAAGLDRIDFLVWGDSHARAIGRFCDSLAKEHGLRGAIAVRTGTLPLLGTERLGQDRHDAEWNNAVLQFARAHHIQHVFLVSRWSHHVSRTTSRTKPVTTDTTHGVESSNGFEAIQHGLKRTVAELSIQGAKIWILGQVPEQYRDPNKAILRSYLLGLDDPTGVSFQEHETRQSNINRLFQSLSTEHVTFLDSAPYCFDAHGRSIVNDAGGSFYWDDNHLTTHGAKMLLTIPLAQVFSEIKQSLLCHQD